jgi:hypothetical protein
MFKSKLINVTLFGKLILENCIGECRNILFSFSIFLILFSCSNKQEKVLNFDDLSKSSEKYKENLPSKDSTTTLSNMNELLSNFSKTWIDSLNFNSENIHLLDTNLFSDRFGAKKSEKWYYLSEKDSFVFMHWEFKDSIKTQNTFYNWLDCFGSTCKSIVIGQEVKLSKKSLVFLLQNNHLFSLESNKNQNLERYLSLFDNIKWNKNWKYIMNQDVRKKTTWYHRTSEGKLEQTLQTQ